MYYASLKRMYKKKVTKVSCHREKKVLARNRVQPHLIKNIYFPFAHLYMQIHQKCCYIESCIEEISKWGLQFSLNSAYFDIMYLHAI